MSASPRDIGAELCTPRSRKHHDFVWSDTDITVFGGSAGCLVASAEYLTPTGWKKIGEYDGGLVGQYNHSTGNIEMVQPLEYIKRPCTTMKRMVARGLDFIMSPEHRVPYFNDHDTDKVKVISFEEVVARHERSKTKGWTGSIKTTYGVDREGFKLDGKLVSDDMLRLLIAVQADGSIDRGTATYLRFSKHRKDERLRGILDRLGLAYTRTVNSCDKYTSGIEYIYKFYINYRTKILDRAWYECNQHQLQVIVDEVGHWDSNLVENGCGTTIRFSCNFKENVDFIQYAAHACGYNTSLCKDKRENKYLSEHYTLNCTKRGKGFRRFSNKDGKCAVTDVLTDDGYKYCFTVPSTFFLVRMNNKIFITGNSGKTWQGLVRFLQFVNEPEYIGYVIRKTQASLKFGAFKTAIRLFTAWDNRVKINRVDMTFKFPSGCTIIFKGLDGNSSIEYFQGQEISGALVDEATHIKFGEIEWLMTRLRTNAKNVKPSIWFTCNPDPDHFIAKWVDPYLYPKKTMRTDPDTGRVFDIGGRVDPEKNGKTRYYYVIDGLWVWDDDRDVLIERCKNLIYDKSQKPMSFKFIGATCHDNPVLLEEQPDYLNNMLNKSKIEVERLVFGNWYIREEGVGYWKNEWCRKIDSFPVQNDDVLPPDDSVDKRVRCWDLAWTEPNDSNPDPDYTAGVLMFRTKKGYYVVENVVRGQMRAGSVYKYIATVAKKDYEYYGIVPQFIPEDPAAGKATYQFAREYLMSNGIAAVNKVTGSKQANKLERFKNFAAASENKAVLIIKGTWNDEYFSELEVFDGTRNTRHDD